jgi:hypothetical protein
METEMKNKFVGNRARRVREADNFAAIYELVI